MAPPHIVDVTGIRYKPKLSSLAPHIYGWSPLGNTIEVFSFYEDAKKDRVKVAPHLEFANIVATDDEIKRFTLQWGPLVLEMRSGAKPSGWTDAFTPPGYVGDFEIALDLWRKLHRTYVRMVKLAESGDRQALAAVVDAQRAAALAWLDDRDNGLVVKFRAENLWSSLVLMFVLDLEGKIIPQRCENVNCGRFFSTSRPGVKYCQDACGHAVAARKYWGETGATRRAARRKAEKKKQTPKAGPAKRRSE